MKLFRILSFAAIVSLSGCATGPAALPPENTSMSWEARQLSLENIQSWQVKGAIGIQQGQEATSANLLWQQFDASTYQINLQGPLGVGAIKLVGNTRAITLFAANNKQYTASSPENLLASQTGWYIPVSNLYYWVRGLPVPGIAANLKFDQYKHLALLNQEGWLVQYQRYTAVNGLDLPSKIILTKPPFTIRLVLNNWQKIQV